MVVGNNGNEDIDDLWRECCCCWVDFCWSRGCDWGFCEIVGCDWGWGWEVMGFCWGCCCSCGWDGMKGVDGDCSRSLDVGWVEATALV